MHRPLQTQVVLLSWPVLWLAAWLAASLGGCAPEPQAPTALPPLPERVQTPGPGVLEARPLRTLGLALTGELRGEIEPCGCPTLPYGGFVRRERLLERLRGAQRPLFVLDAGAALLKGVTSSKGEDVHARAALIARLMVQVGVDAMAPGPDDLRALGPEGLRALPGQGLTLVSATWAGPDGARVFPAAVVLERDGLKIGVVGLSAPPGEGSGWQALDPASAAREALASLPPGLDLVVALSNLGEATDTRVLAEVPGFAALLRGKGALHDPPRAESGALVVEAPDRGRYVTALHLALQGPPSQGLEPDEGPWRELLQALDVQARLGARGVGPALAEQLPALEAALVAQAQGLNRVVVEDLPLGRELDGEAQVEAALLAFREARLGEARRGVQAEPAPGHARYVGSGSCVRCHSVQSARWTYTAHAQAGVSLLERGEHQNPECVACHSTGFGEPGGFAELNSVTLRSWGGVQCEACHGPLGGHPRDERVQPQPVRELTCLRCHDAANSPDFELVPYLRQVVCPADPVADPGDGAEATVP